MMQQALCSNQLDATITNYKALHILDIHVCWNLILEEKNKFSTFKDLYYDGREYENTMSDEGENFKKIFFRTMKNT